MLNVNLELSYVVTIVEALLTYIIGVIVGTYLFINITWKIMFVIICKVLFFFKTLKLLTAWTFKEW